MLLLLSSCLAPLFLCSVVLLLSISLLSPPNVSSVLALWASLLPLVSFLSAFTWLEKVALVSARVGHLLKQLVGLLGILFLLDQDSYFYSVGFAFSAAASGNAFDLPTLTLALSSSLQLAGTVVLALCTLGLFVEFFFRLLFSGTLVNTSPVIELARSALIFTIGALSASTIAHFFISS